MNNKGKNPPRRIFHILLNFALDLAWVQTPSFGCWLPSPTPSASGRGFFSVRKLYCDAVIKLSISTKLRVILSGATAESKDLAQRPARWFWCKRTGLFSVRELYFRAVRSYSWFYSDWNLPPANFYLYVSQSETYRAVGISYPMDISCRKHIARPPQRSQFCLY